MADPEGNTNIPVEGGGAGGGEGVSPEPREFLDTDMVRIPGQDKPVAYGELYKRLQGDHTRKTQDLSKARTALDAERKQLQAGTIKRERELQGLASQLLEMRNRAGSGGGQAPYYLTDLEGKPVLDGKTAAQLMRAVQKDGFGSVERAFQQRDQTIQNLSNQLTKMSAVIQTLTGERSEAGFNTKIGGWLRDLDLDEGYSDLAKEVYLSHEGSDLDQEFPEILKARVEQVEKLIAARQKKKLDDRRAAPFNFPGKGGQGSAAKVKGLTGREKASDVADALWEQIQASDGKDT